MEEPGGTFQAGLELVLGVLRERRESGSSMKATAESLSCLRECAGSRRVERGPGAERSEVKTVRQPEVEPVRSGVSRREVQGAPKEQAMARFGEGQPVQGWAGPPPAKSVELKAFTGDKREALAALRVEAAGCQRCPNLARSRFSVVFGEGDPEAELMFVGEAPGAEEDQRGEPFVGAAGELLEKMIVAMGLDRSQVYIANVLKCRPDVPEGVPGNRKPTGEEMERCLPFLRRQIEIVRPRVMVALGATAMQGLLGRTEPMARLRAQWHDFAGIPVMATYHPSYLLRNQAASEKRKVWEDLLQVMERLGLSISARQRGFFLSKKG